MNTSEAMATSVEASDDSTTSELSAAIPRAVAGSKLISRIDTATMLAPRPYHSLGLPRESTTGAHSIFQVCGHTDSASSPAITAVGTPAWPSWKPSVTVT